MGRQREAREVRLLGRILLLAVLTCSAFSICAREAIARDTAIPAIEYLDDPSGSLSLDDVARGPAAAHFRPLEDLSEDLHYRYVTRWFRFAAPDNRGEPLMLWTLNTTDDADLYYRRTGGSNGYERFGMTVPFSRRAYSSTETEVRIPADAIPKSTMYVRLYGSIFTQIEIFPISQDAAHQLAIFDPRAGYVFIGLVGAVGLFSLALALYLRDGAYALNAFAMATTVLYYLTVEGLSWQYLWPNTSIGWAVPYALTGSLWLVATFLFVRRFLRLRAVLPWLDTILWVVVVAVCVWNLVLQPIFPDVDGRVFSRSAWLLLALAPLLRIRADRGARYLATGLIVYAALPTLNYLLDAFNVNEVSRAGLALIYVADNALAIGAGFFALTFQLALADRTLTVTRERLELQSKHLAAQEELLEAERRSVERLATYNAAFARFVPRDFLERLGHADVVSVQLGDHVERDMAVLFTDIRSFTTLSEAMTPEENFAFINAYLSRAGPIVREHRGFIDKYIGDAIMALFDDAASAVDAAIALQTEVRRFNEARARTLLPPIAVGVGLHRGKLMLGTVGEHERFDTTVISDAVNVASRLESLTKEYGAGIIASDAVVNALGERGNVRSLGSVKLKGLSRATPVFELCDADPPELLLHKMATRERFETAVEAYGSQEFARAAETFAAIVEQNPKDAAAEHFRSRALAMKR